MNVEDINPARGLEVFLTSRRTAKMFEDSEKAGV